MADLATWKNWVDILQDVVQTLAIIVAGGWAIWRFWINRERHPKADIQHSVECFPIGDSQHLVHVAITVKNVGSVLMKPTLLLVRILQVLPLDEEMQNRLITGE